MPRSEAAFYEWTDSNDNYWVTGPVPGPCVITECVARISSVGNANLRFAMALGLIETIDGTTFQAAKHLIRRGVAYHNRQASADIFVTQRQTREILRRPFVMVPSGVRYLYCYANSDQPAGNYTALSEIIYLDIDEYRALYGNHRTVSILAPGTGVAPGREVTQTPTTPESPV